MKWRAAVVRVAVVALPRHEADYGLRNILKNARATEHAAQDR